LKRLFLAITKKMTMTPLTSMFIRWLTGHTHNVSYWSTNIYDMTIHIILILSSWKAAMLPQLHVQTKEFFWLCWEIWSSK
jgi:hypothetical protein